MRPLVQRASAQPCWFCGTTHTTRPVRRRDRVGRSVDEGSAWHHCSAQRHRRFSWAISRRDLTATVVRALQTLAVCRAAIVDDLPALAVAHGADRRGAVRIDEVARARGQDCKPCDEDAAPDLRPGAYSRQRYVELLAPHQHDRTPQRALLRVCSQRRFEHNGSARDSTTRSVHSFSSPSSEQIPLAHSMSS